MASVTLERGDWKDPGVMHDVVHRSERTAEMTLFVLGTTTCEGPIDREIQSLPPGRRDGGQQGSLQCCIRTIKYEKMRQDIGRYHFIYYTVFP